MTTENLLKQQMVLEFKYSKENARKLIKHELETCFNTMYLVYDCIASIEKWLLSSSYESKQLRKQHLIQSEYNLLNFCLGVMVVVLREGKPQPLQSVAGIMAPTFGFEDIFDGVKTASELMGIMCEHDLFDIEVATLNDENRMMIIPLWKLDDEIKQHLINIRYQPPMVSKPIVVMNNRAYQYYSFSESLLLGTPVNHHDMPLALDVINLMNNQALSLDYHVLQLEELPNKPLDTLQKQEQFTQMKQASRTVYNEMLDHGNKFYLTHKFDKRGRLYSQGYHINIQSTEYKKALINFAKKEVVKL
tara:strand:- start:7125 stop:8036 length:912 start_codon:yes stop_codon:yes gene_type:complete